MATAGSAEARELEKVKKAFDKAYKESAIDKNSQTQYNLSRKNDYGDNINNFYRALNKEQWRDFYQQIADNGYLEYTDVGDIATVVVGNKLIVAERRTTGKDAHDFQVDDVYELIGNNNSVILYDIKNEIEESGVLNGNESIAEKVFGVFKAASGKGNMYRFDRNKLRFVNHLTNGQNGNNDSKINGIFETKSNGQRVSIGNEQNIQGIEIESFNYQNESKADSNGSASSIGKKKQYSLSDTNIESLDDIETKYKDKTDVLFLHEGRNDTLSISNMVVKKEYRNQGIGTQILNDIISYADENGKTITLTPTTEFGTQNKLKKWYKANGFVENKGRNTDLRLSDTMYRLPKKFNNEKAQPQKQFSLSNPVEETKDLVAVHNLSEENLLKSLKLGGLPMPSIAIIKAKNGHNNFGDISLVFDKSTIDPKLSKYNKVFTSDAYTPTYPQIDYKIDSEVVEKGVDEVERLCRFSQCLPQDEYR